MELFGPLRGWLWREINSASAPGLHSLSMHSALSWELTRVFAFVRKLSDPQGRGRSRRGNTRGRVPIAVGPGTTWHLTVWSASRPESHWSLCHTALPRSTDAPVSHTKKKPRLRRASVKPRRRSPEEPGTASGREPDPRRGRLASSSPDSPSPKPPPAVLAATRLPATAETRLPPCPPVLRLLRTRSPGSPAGRATAGKLRGASPPCDHAR